MSTRIVILALECDATTVLINALSKEQQLAGILYEQPVSKKALIKNRIKRLGWWKVLGQLLFIITMPRLLKWRSAKRVKEILSENDLDISPVAKDRVKKISSVNSEESIRLLRSLEPDLVILSGTRIVSQQLLKEIDTVFINIHAGITPLYRGVHGAYWALVEGNPGLCGVTLHYVDKGIDTGAVIAQCLVKPVASDNFSTYPYLQMAAGIDLLKKNLQPILQKMVQPPALLTNRSQLRYHPTLAAYIKYYFTRKVK